LRNWAIERGFCNKGRGDADFFIFALQKARKLLALLKLFDGKVSNPTSAKHATVTSKWLEKPKLHLDNSTVDN
jgi:hypothetical protein